MKSRLDLIGDWAGLAKAANYSVEGLAEKCGVSTRQLQKFFLRRTGLSPHRWFTELRQMEALALRSEGKGVKEMAYALGYRQVSHFSREFKLFHGISPSDVSGSAPPRRRVRI